MYIFCVKPTQNLNSASRNRPISKPYIYGKDEKGRVFGQVGYGLFND